MEFVTDDEEGDDEGLEEDLEPAGDQGPEVYLPGKKELQDNEELVMDESAYRMYHQAQTGEISNFPL